MSIDLGPRVGAPPKPLNVKAENSGQSSNPELLGGALLAFTAAADPMLRLGQFLDVDKLLKTIWNTTKY